MPLNPGRKLIDRQESADFSCLDHDGMAVKHVGSVEDARAGDRECHQIVSVTFFR